MTTTLPDGEGGFPGNRTLTARFTVQDTTLHLTLTATTDAPTLMNLANHSYWNLGPYATTAGHSLTIAADHYLPGDPATTIPTGEIRTVSGTGFDYRKPRPIRAGQEGLLDLNFCLSTQRQTLRPVATLTGPTGIRMTMATTELGLQLFDGHITGMANTNDLDGKPTQDYAGLALEAQFWPDAPNNPGFPDITLQPNQSWTQQTSWTFTR